MYAYRKFTKIKKEAGEEAGKLEKNGWRSSWNPGREKDKKTNNSPGTMMATSGVHVDFTAKSLHGYVGGAAGAIK